MFFLNMIRKKKSHTEKQCIAMSGYPWEISRALSNQWKSVQRLQWDSDQAPNSAQAFLARLNYGSPGSPGKPRHELHREKSQTQFL